MLRTLIDDSMRNRAARLSAAAVAIALLAWVGRVAHAAEEVTVNRDVFGVPHIFAETEEGAIFALGYAQAEDRLEELLRNYRKAEGSLAEAFGEEFYRHDVRQRMWRHAAISKETYPKKSPKTRAITEAFQAGIKLYMETHPENVPDWAPPIEPYQVGALGRFIIWGWPEGDAARDLRNGGIQPDPIAYRGSNQWLIAPSRTESGVAIALIDPHLSWYGEFRFYESRLYGGDLNFSGMGIVGLPLAGLGHSAYCSVAMTTGGPDTGDVYKDTLNPDNPLQYRYDGAWRTMEVVKEIILVKTDQGMDRREVELHYTHRGPVVARKDGFAYTMALSYFDAVDLLEQAYRMAKARNLTEMKQALSMLQYMSQNIMVGTVDGDIYYLRNGRVPVRPAGFDFTRPVPGDTSASEWRGTHRLADLVQIENPAQGYMQNCNVSPFSMMVDSPLIPERYPNYIYNAGRTPPHQRAAMTLEQLRADSSVTLAEALEIAMSVEVYGAAAWQERLDKAARRLRRRVRGDPGASELKEMILAWDRRSRRDSTAALAYWYWKEALPKSAKSNDRMGGPPNIRLTDEQCVEALMEGAAKMRGDHGSLRAPYGKMFRVGRRDAGRSYPVGGGNPGNGMATPRAIGFRDGEDGEKIGRSGQTSTQIVLLTRPPQSWTYLPLGESDDPDSPHFDDQARLLFGERRMKPTYFMQPDELKKYVESITVLEF